MTSRNTADSNDSQLQQEEGVLKDVLDELDRERTKRAELQALVRKLVQEKEQLAQRAARPAAEHPAIPHRVFRSMEIQVEGYREIIDALTLSKPAIAAAAAMEKEEASLLARRGGQNRKQNTNAQQLQRKTRKTLPLHIVRLLEVLPWDARAKQHVFATEEIFEWQVYREDTWQSHLKYFPTQFKSLHVVKATSKQTTTTNNPNGFVVQDSSGIPDQHQSDSKKDRSFLFFLAGGEMQSSNNTHTSAIAMSRRKAEHRILTDERVTILYDTDAGYPLPQNDGGVWEWLGSWRVGKHEPRKNHIASTTEAELEAQKRADCDEQGWSYVVEPQDFLLGLPDMIWDNPGGGDESALTATAINATASDKNNSKSSNSNTATAVVKRTFRRRRWVRQRILVDYPYASEGTRQYLLLLKENARLSGAASKISDQLVETKATLTESEEKLMQARDALRQKDAALKAAGIITEESTLDDDADDENMLQLQQQWRQWKQQQDQQDHSENNESDIKLQTSYSLAPEMIRTMSKDGGAFGAKLTQWVQQAARKTSEDLTSNDDESEEASNNGSGHGASSASVDWQQHPSSSADKFDWKKIGRGQFINKLKSPNRSSNLTSQLKKGSNGRNIFRKADPLTPRAGEPALQTSASEDPELL